MAHMTEEEYAKLQAQINAKKVAKDGVSTEPLLDQTELASELLELIAIQRRLHLTLKLEVERLKYGQLFELVALIVLALMVMIRG